MRTFLAVLLAVGLQGCFITIHEDGKEEGGDATTAQGGPGQGGVTGNQTGSGGTTNGSVDADNDGFPADEDCDDTVPTINPAATDIVGDGIDQNCDGIDGTDGDGDGVASEASGGSDCDDGDGSVYPGAVDDFGDGVDQDCSGADGVDADGDGYPSGPDCADQDPSVNPEASDTVGDKIDQNCDGVDGVDVDGDGVADEVSGGLDCDDSNPQAYPGAADVDTDGSDQDCDGVDGPDADGDGHADVATGGDDCNDGDPAVSPSTPEVCNNADDNCDGLIDENQDAVCTCSFLDDAACAQDPACALAGGVPAQQSPEACIAPTAPIADMGVYGAECWLIGGHDFAWSTTGMTLEHDLSTAGLVFSPTGPDTWSAVATGSAWINDAAAPFQLEAESLCIALGPCDAWLDPFPVEVVFEVTASASGGQLSYAVVPVVQPMTLQDLGVANCSLGDILDVLNTGGFFGLLAAEVEAELEALALDAAAELALALDEAWLAPTPLGCVASTCADEVGLVADPAYPSDCYRTALDCPPQGWTTCVDTGFSAVEVCLP